MDRFDFSPLYRSTIGFDRLTRLVDAASRVDSTAVAYPPYNIQQTGEDAYRLTMAVAGFAPAELDITVQENTLLVAGKAQKEDENSGGYLHRGIARRAFERCFSLADHMKVVGASLDNGMLSVDGSRSARGNQAAHDQGRHHGRNRAAAGDGAKGRLIGTSNANHPNVETPSNCGAFPFPAYARARAAVAEEQAPGCSGAAVYVAPSRRLAVFRSGVNWPPPGPSCRRPRRPRRAGPRPGLRCLHA
jgi:molecular chaperone IbpA